MLLSRPGARRISDECGSGIKVVLKIGFKFELGVALRAAQHCCKLVSH